MLNKPAGLVVHPAAGHADGTLVNALLAHAPELAQLPRAGIVHRLDRGTSGCLVMTRNRDALRRFQTALTENRLHKQYQALLMGKLARTPVQADMPLLKSQVRGGERMVVVSADGKPAVSAFEMLESYPRASLVGVELETGRTHQIRVHATAIGHPVAGDSKYGDKAFNQSMRELGLKRLFLHAHRIDLAYPGGELLPVHAPMPESLQQVLARL